MSGPNAVNDILNNPRFQGAMDSISGLTEFIDGYFVMFISVISFLIISGSMLRNVIAGAYAAFPKFWDGISEAKESLIDKGNAGGRAGILFKITAFFFPDLKRMSDFHDNNIEPKDYFMKAIPKMIVIVMIGVVIYNGYYRDGVAMTASFGSELIQRFFLNVDPVAAFDKVFENAARPDFATAEDKSDMGNYAEKVSKEIYSGIVTYWTDVKSKSAKSSLTQNVESWVLQSMETNLEYWDEDKYKIAIQVDKVMGEPNLDRLKNGDNDIISTFAWSTPVTTFAFESSMHGNENWHIRFVARFEKIPEKDSNSRVLSKLVLEVPAASIAEASNEFVLKLPNSDMFIVSGKVTVNGQAATWNAQKGELRFPKQDSKADMNVSVTGFGYKVVDDTGASRTHTIRQIKAGGSGKASFSQGEQKFDIGSGPVFKKEE